MEATSKVLTDLAATVEVPADGILSRTVYRDSRQRLVMFAFAKGEELSEHTAGVAAVVQVLRGEMSMTIGEASHELGPGAWVWMAPNISHSLLAKTDLVVSLTLFLDPPLQVAGPS